LTREQVAELARFNGEVARGLVHTPEWKRRMALLQEAFDQRYRAPNEPMARYDGRPVWRSRRPRWLRWGEDG
jgi:hypothetical protein